MAMDATVGDRAVHLFHTLFAPAASHLVAFAFSLKTCVKTFCALNLLDELCFVGRRIAYAECFGFGFNFSKFNHKNAPSK
jgi:hypothetical protein